MFIAFCMLPYAIFLDDHNVNVSQKRETRSRLEPEQLAGCTGGHSNIEGFFEQFNGSLSGAVAGNQEIDFKCLKRLDGEVEAQGCGADEVKAANEGADLHAVVQAKDVTKGVHHAGMAAAGDHDQAFVRADPESHVIIDGIRSLSGGIEIKRPAGVLKRHFPGDVSGQADMVTQAQGFLDPVEPFFGQLIHGGHGCMRHVDGGVRTVSDGVARHDRPRMTVNMALAAVLQKRGNPAGVIVMTMAQNEKIGAVHIDAQFPGVAFDYFPGSCIKKDTPAINLDPHGQAVLFLQTPFSPVVR